MSIFRQSIEKITVSLKSDKNNGFFTYKPIYIYGPPGWGVGRGANNLTPEKTALFKKLIEAKTGLIFWSDTGEGKD